MSASKHARTNKILVDTPATRGLVSRPSGRSWQEVPDQPTTVVGGGVSRAVRARDRCEGADLRPGEVPRRPRRARPRASRDDAGARALPRVLAPVRVARVRG